MNGRMAVALTATLFSSLLATSVFADALGDRLALVACWNLKVGQSYTLTSSEEQNWYAKQIQGVNQSVNGPQTVSATFEKQVNHNDGSCTLRTTYSGSTIVCDKYDIAKSGSALTMKNKRSCP